LLKRVNELLKDALQERNSERALRLCDKVKSKLEDAEKIFAKKNINSPAQDDGIANAYHSLGGIFDGLQRPDMAKESHAKASEWGHIHSEALQTGLPQHSSKNETAKTDESIPLIFSHNVVLPVTKYELPQDDARVASTLQLAYSLSLMLPSSISENKLDASDSNTQQNIVNSDEQDRLRNISTNIVRAFIRDELKKPDVVAEVVSLAAVLDQDDFRELLRAFVDGIEHSVLLKVHLLDGLAHLIRNAAPGYIDVDDIVKILGLLNMRLERTHLQSSQHIYRLAMTVSRVLDSMVDSQVKGLKREQLHEPLLIYLKDLQASSDPYMIYQAAYAYQALQYISDDETIFQATLRRTGKVVQGISGVVSAVKALDLNRFLQGLGDLQKGPADPGNAIVAANDAYQHARTLAESGQNLFESLKEGLSFGCKRTWYPALRGLDLLVQEGRLVEFEKLIRKAPCRQDPAFQWGVCQRLGEIAVSTLWDSDIRQCATLYLGEFYRDNVIWGRQASIEPLIHCIFSELTGSSDVIVAGHALEQLQELKTKQLLSQNNTSSYPIAVTLPPQASPLLEYVQNNPDVETILRRLRRKRPKKDDQD
ncbi:hypothetical protein BGX27_001610, partial [Mortierella sp. AM989]